MSAAESGAPFDPRSLRLGSEHAAGLLLNGFPTDAVRIAAQQFIEDVRVRSQREDLDGAPLMHAVLRPDEPTLALPSERDRDWRNRQEGFRFLAAGLTLHVRNYLAHTPDEVYSDDEALEWLSLISALQRLLDQTILVEEDAVNRE